ncbi:MAG: hypothetical protein JNJ85_07355 [Candidatus Kapabacteria bacterium]|nr:hypothetical protein [Candidatus Kapabacteria bacterium]
MKYVLLMLVFFLANITNAFTQEYEWGYRFTVGQKFTYKVEFDIQALSNISGSHNNSELISFRVIQVDKDGSITFQIWEQKSSNIDSIVVIGSEATGAQVMSRTTTHLDGSEATITMTRYGEFVHGTYHKPSASLLEMRKMRLADTSEFGKTSAKKHSEENQLKSTLELYFPKLKSTEKISHQEQWKDSVGQEKKSYTLKDGNLVASGTKSNHYDVKEYRYIKDTLIDGIDCMKVLLVQNVRQAMGKDRTFSAQIDGYLYFRKSDGMLLLKEVNGSYFNNGEMINVLRNYQKLEK